MNSNLTTIVVLVTVIHVVVLVVMIWIRVRRTPGDGIAVGTAKITPCAVCGEPATDWCYDGLDPNEQRDPHTGRVWSADAARYRPVCAAHSAPARCADGSSTGLRRPREETGVRRRLRSEICQRSRTASRRMPPPHRLPSACAW